LLGLIGWELLCGSGVFHQVTELLSFPLPFWNEN